ncbi:putative LRR receptor-like serine/threonine-protein kinase [Hordeum vulgare]|nr:putative LRR receptor-like serine/threonine-protein kinase [Hordeum vulgare]
MIPPPLNQAKERWLNSRDVPDLTRVQQLPKWCPPVEHATKINADGGFSKIGDRGASAAVCRNKEGLYLGASAIIYEGLQDPSVLEAHACLEALALAKDLKTQSVCIAYDCSEVVSNIEKEAERNTSIDRFADAASRLHRAR